MDREIWKNPQAAKELEEAEIPLWFWNDKLEKTELLRQLKMKTEIGVTCTIPHARTNGGEGYIGGYLDEDWFDKIDTVVEYKKKHQEPLWLYDEIDWPAGTCNKTITLEEKYREQYLTFQKFEIPACLPFRAQLKSIMGKRITGNRGTVEKGVLDYNIFIFDKVTMQAYDIREYFKYLIFGPELEFQADRDAVAYVAKVQVDAYEYGGKGQVSYINGEATRAFLQSTYEKYREHYREEFGTTITGVFNDETRMCNPLPWCEEFPGVFQERKGYSILSRLADLILPGETPGRTRCDYFDVIAYLFQTRYFGEIHKWCQGNNLKLFAHLLGEETIYGHARYSGDYLRQNKYLDIPGADHLGKGIGSLNIKYTASGAHSYGKDMTAVEVFAGCGWDFTFEEYIRMVTWMYQMGMKIIINHGFFYSDRGARKNDWPPSQFFQWQGWSRMKEGNAMIRRLHYALTGGHSEMDVLVYHPMESFWLQYMPDLLYTHGFAEGPFLENDQAARMDRELQLLLNALLSANIDFELLHKDAVENFKAENGFLINTKTGQHFSLIILPMCRVLPVEAVRLLKQFAEGGGHLLALEELPAMAMPQNADSEVIQAFREMKAQGKITLLPIEDKEAVCSEVIRKIPHPVKIVQGSKGTVNNHLCYPSYLIDPYLHTGEDITGVMFTRYRKNGQRNTLFMNYGTEEITVEVAVEADKRPEVWDTFTGTVQEAEVMKVEEHMYYLLLSLPCNYGVIVRG